MPIDTNSTISELPESYALSVRARNACRAAGISTLSDLLRKTEGELLAIPHCGQKTVKELLGLKERLAMQGGRGAESPFNPHPPMQIDLDGYILEDSLAEILASEEKGGPRHDAFRRLGYPDGAGLPAALAGNPGLLATALDPLPVTERIELAACMRSLLEDWAAHDAIPDYWSGQILHTADVLGHILESSRLEARYFTLPAKAHEELERRFRNNYYQRISTRARNQLGDVNNVISALPYALGCRHDSLSRLKDCGKQTANQIEHLFSLLYRDYMEVLRRYPEERTAPGDWQDAMAAKQVAYEYPFLKPSECEYVVKARQEGIQLSPLYLLRRYICSHGQTRARAFVRFYGRDGKPAQTMMEISEALDLTRERVRQLLSGRVRYPESLAPQVEEARRLFHAPFIPSYSGLLREAVEAPGADMTVRQLMGLLCSIDNDYCIEEITNGSNSYLVRRELVKGINVMMSYNALRREATLSRREPLRIRLEDYIESNRNAAPDLSSLPVLRPLFLDELSLLPNVELLPDGEIELQPTRTDLGEAVCKVLADRGKAMSFQEIIDGLAQLSPGAEAHPAAVKLSIYQSDRIASVGRSGMYVLTEWDHVFTGTQMEYVEQLLAEAVEPMPIQKIVEKAREHFPTTGDLSLITQMQQDPKGRFCAFRANFFGLRSRHYPGWEDRRQRTHVRKNFDQRFADYRAFVEREGRLPVFAAPDEEASLARWRWNIEKGIIRHTEQQREDFRQFLEAHEELPRNSKEMAYLEMCREVERIAESERRLPDPAVEATQYAWLHTGALPSGGGNWGDNRDLYLERLRARLAELGLQGL